MAHRIAAEVRGQAAFSDEKWLAPSADLHGVGLVTLNKAQLAPYDKEGESDEKNLP